MITIKKYPEAQKFLKQASEINKNHNNHYGISTNLINIGWNYESQSDFTKAKSYYQQLLDLWQQYGFNIGIVKNLNRLGYTHLK